MNKYCKGVLALSLSFTPSLCQAEWSGDITLQNRTFRLEPLMLNPQQHNNYLSISSEIEYYTDLNSNDKSFTFIPFIRLDQYDKQRSHGDIRELSYEQVFDSWELRLGISKVYWGVTESQHLVDVINQTDNVENIDFEDKLGQPMIKAGFEQDWGMLDIFILPYFRERTFQGIQGRPRSFPVVDTNQASYESSAGKQHTDIALRWFNTLDDLELGLSYFIGTSREALFLPGSKNNRPVITPYYPQMQQLSLDAQLTTEEWLWKIEAIARDWQKVDRVSAQISNERFIAATGGFEYTFVGVIESDADLGMVMEYLYDDRSQAATSLFQNDLMFGVRLALNDVDSTEALLGIIYDLDNNEHLISLEASQRIAENWTTALEIRGFNNISSSSLGSSIRNDDFIQIDLAYYF